MTRAGLSPIVAPWRSKLVRVYAYSALPERWWDPIRKDFERTRNLEVLSVSADSASSLGAMAATNMKLQCQIQEGEIWMRDGEGRETAVGMARLN